MIEIYDDKISIVSPGGVPKGITKENFGKRSIARNPIIADLLRRTHYTEFAFFHLVDFFLYSLIALFCFNLSV